MKYQSSSSPSSKVYSKVKVSDRFTEQQNDRQDKNSMTLTFDLGGITITFEVDRYTCKLESSVLIVSFWAIKLHIILSCKISTAQNYASP